MKKYSYILENLDCANCANKIEQRLSKEQGLEKVVVNFNTSKLSYESESDVKEKIISIIQGIEPGVLVLEQKSQSKSSVFDIARFIMGLLLIGVSYIVPTSFQLIFIIFAYIILLSRTFMNALRLLIHSKSINENFLVFISCVGAFCIGDTMEGLMVIVLYEIGKILEDRAVHKTRKSIQDLMNIKPEYANLKRDDKTEKVQPELVKIDDTLVIKKGEKIPLDGFVIKGLSELDVKALTGESKYKSVKIGDSVLSGSVNITGILEIKVTKLYRDSTVSRILELVENATDKKAKTETFVSKAARIYTPIIVILAIMVAVLLPLVTTVSYQDSIYKALTFLVISCPCAIAISVPLSYFSGIGRSSKSGILIKGSDYLDSLQHITEIIFDKTGTLTTGNFEVAEIISFDEKHTQDYILNMIAKAEAYSNHPIAKSILNKLTLPLDNTPLESFEELEGKGLQYQEEGKIYKIGNASFVEKEIIKENGTTIYLKKDKTIIGAIVLEDKVKEETICMLRNLHKLGIKTRMFTGDNQDIALAIANKIGIDEFSSEMLPNDKYTALEQLLKQRDKKEKIAFVGDGINDAPVLALADIGISMGGVGSASAIEASDVVIMNDDLRKIPEAISISKYTNKIIKQNLLFAISVKVLVLSMSVLGFATMWQAIFADVGVTLLTILNTLRILHKK